MNKFTRSQTFKLNYKYKVNPLSIKTKSRSLLMPFINTITKTIKNDQSKSNINELPFELHDIYDAKDKIVSHDKLKQIDKEPALKVVVNQVLLNMKKQKLFGWKTK